MFRALLCLLLSLPAALSTLAGQSRPNPLQDRLWSPAQQRFIDWPEFYRDWLPEGGWLLLGEQHDNPDHHRRQAELIRTLGERGVLGKVALEMATGAQQEALNRAYRDPPARTEEALGWSRGWPWSLYQEPVLAAFRWSRGVVGADLTRDEVMQVYNGEPGKEDLGAEHADFIRELLFDSHCGRLPRTQLEPMRQVQLARDRHIAEVLKSNVQPDRTGVLLTGSIHARTDLGVPLWLDGTPHLSLLLVTLDSAEQAEDYLPPAFGDRQPAQLILFTPPREAPDYCAGLAE